uniref:Uncharacterized protein n=1 Tax=Pithovirus LCPAC304 TaxID=2506594 RepID=A0A481Z8S0_9VIRU|nr:MAG: hypothetical protein LCPAC304_06310 [Pithovirus LCPAC304]
MCINDEYFWKISFERTFTPLDFRIGLYGIETWREKCKKCVVSLSTLPKLGVECTHRFMRGCHIGQYCRKRCSPGLEYCYECSGTWQAQQRKIKHVTRTDTLRVRSYKRIPGYFFHPPTRLVLKMDNNVIYMVARDVSGHVQLLSPETKKSMESSTLKIPATLEKEKEELALLVHKISHTLS